MNFETKSRIAIVDCVRLASLRDRSAFLGDRAVSPIEAPMTGAVRPQLVQGGYGLAQVHTGTNKGDLGLRSLGPPI